MKKLKLDHELAQMVLAGTKTSTWRVFDDKDLAVNDDVELIDKVDSERPQTWRVIGTARIDRIIEKRVGDIQPEDYDGHEVYSSSHALLTALQGYYGDRVTFDTPIKMVNFIFAAASTGEKAGEVTSSHGDAIRQVILYADGGSRGNPGPSAAGYVLLDQNEQVLVDKGVYLGVTTNNQAEYQGLKAGLEEAHRMGAREVDVRLDSMLVVNQMKGVFKVKNRDLWPIHQAVAELAADFEDITFTHVPRELNQLADAAVNRALDEAANDS